MYFGNRRPRGFHYTFRFSNERRDIISDLRRGVSPDVLARRSLSAGEPSPRHASRRVPFAFYALLFVAALVLLAFLSLVLLS